MVGFCLAWRAVSDGRAVPGEVAIGGSGRGGPQKFLRALWEEGRPHPWPHPALRGPAKWDNVWTLAFVAFADITRAAGASSPEVF